MAFAFPDVPVVDETVTFGEVAYKWNLEKWMRLPKGATSLAAVIHDTSLIGDGTAASPLSVNIMDAGASFARSLAREPAQGSNQPPDTVSALIARVDEMERELTRLKGRPLTPLQRAASRARPRRS